MNNSKLVLDTFSLAEDKEDEIKTKLRTEEARILRIVEALREIQQTKEWATLKADILDNLVNVLEKNLREEAKKEDPSSNKLNRLAGELKWAERYSDLAKLENNYLVQLKNIRIKLYGKENE